MNNDFLRALEANTSQSVARRIKRRLSDIEAALALGFTHREIHAQLERDGIVLTVAYYQRLITRLRSQGRKLEGTPASKKITDEHVGAHQGASVSPSVWQPHERQTNTVRTSRDDELSAGLAGNSAARPRTISPKPPERKKFVWDPHGANKIDPNNF